jgi:hypothetical protein
LLRGIEAAQPAIKLELNNWLAFLDDWSQLANLESTKKKPPKKLDRGPDFQISEALQKPA